MDDSRTKSKTPFKKSDRYLLLFLIIALLLVHAILNMLFGMTNINCTKNNINNSNYVLIKVVIDHNNYSNH